MLESCHGGKTVRAKEFIDYVGALFVSHYLTKQLEPDGHFLANVPQDFHIGQEKLNASYSPNGDGLSKLEELWLLIDKITAKDIILSIMEGEGFLQTLQILKDHNKSSQWLVVNLPPTLLDANLSVFPSGYIGVAASSEAEIDVPSSQRGSCPFKFASDISHLNSTPLDLNLEMYSSMTTALIDIRRSIQFDISEIKKEQEAEEQQATGQVNDREELVQSLMDFLNVLGEHEE